MQSTDYTARFGGITRLYGREGLRRLQEAHVAVIGIGGVGSWVAESLVRSGVGHITLVDLDDVCVTNLNRQLQATQKTLGHPKVQAMGSRLLEICPTVAITPIGEFFTEATAGQILSTRYDFVVDAIDSLKNKTLLIARCIRQGLGLVVSGAAGGLRDPTLIRVADLASTTHDRLLAQVRSSLRKDYQLPGGKPSLGVQAVYSLERPVFPGADGTVCRERTPDTTKAGARINCDSGLGSASFVTGAFGLAAAAVVVRQIAENRSSKADRGHI